MLVAVFSASVQAAEIQMQVQAAPATPASPSPTGKLLTIEDAVRIGLDNHPRIKSANERIGSQQAVLGQQMSAYYPTVSLNNRTAPPRAVPTAAMITQRILLPARRSLQHDAL